MELMKPADQIKVAEAIWMHMRIEVGPEFSDLLFGDLMLHTHFVRLGQLIGEGRLVAIRQSLLDAAAAAIRANGARGRD
jgi:hypothetical protein